MLNDFCLAVNFCVLVLIAFRVIHRKLVFIGVILDMVFIFYLIRFYTLAYSYLGSAELFINILLCLMLSVAALTIYARFFNRIFKQESLIIWIINKLRRVLSIGKSFNLMSSLKVLYYMPFFLLSILTIFGLQAFFSEMLVRIKLSVFLPLSMYAVIVIIVLLNYIGFKCKKNKEYAVDLVRRLFSVEDF